MKVFIFSTGPEALHDVQTRLEGMGCEVVWLEVETFHWHLREMREANVVVDLVDWEFRHRTNIDDVEEFLLSELEWSYCSSGKPMLLFLVTEHDHHLDRYVAGAANVLVNRRGQPLPDETLLRLRYRYVPAYANSAELVA